MSLMSPVAPRPRQAAPEHTKIRRLASFNSLGVRGIGLPPEGDSFSKDMIPYSKGGVG